MMIGDGNMLELGSQKKNGAATDGSVVVPIGGNEGDSSLPSSARLAKRSSSAMVGMKQKVPSTTFLCDSLTYTVNGTEILHGLNCAFTSGRLVALMGPSGAGKTTLLNVLAGRGMGTVGGSITLNGIPVTGELMRQQCKVVPQHDELVPVLTAREVLTYTAALAIHGSAAQRRKRVDWVLDTLSISDCADVMCGGADVKGLSGGQRKRVSIGMELLSDPACLLLDEPTSGLDSKVAEDVVDLIKGLAIDGRNVVCTIHQPSFQVFAKFDWLIMLQKGTIAYNGPVKETTPFLNALGVRVPQFVNPADHFLTVLSESREKPFTELFASTAYGDAALRDLEMCKEKSESGASSSTFDAASKAYPTSFMHQFKTIVKRTFHITAKDKRQLRTRLAQMIFIGLIVSTIFWRMDNTQARVQDRLSVLFLCVLALGMSSIMTTALAVPVEKSILIREYSNGYFSIGAYYCGRLLVLLALQILYALFFTSVVYFTVNFVAEADRFFIFQADIVLISMISGIMGYCAGIICPTPQQAVAVVPMIVMPLVIFAGLFIPLENIPGYWVWLYYLSFFQYAIQIAMVNEFQNNYLEACTVEQVLQPKGTCPYGPCSSNFSNPQPCPGDVVLERFDYDPDDTGRNFGILIGYTLLALCVGWFALRRLVGRSR